MSTAAAIVEKLAASSPEQSVNSKAKNDVDIDPKILREMILDSSLAASGADIEVLQKLVQEEVQLIHKTNLSKETPPGGAPTSEIENALGGSLQKYLQEEESIDEQTLLALTGSKKKSKGAKQKAGLLNESDI